MSLEFVTTYEYQPLQSHRHVRFLEITRHVDGDTLTVNPAGLQSVQQSSEMRPVCDNSSRYTFRLVHAKLPTEDEQLDFEALSYTWGAPERVSSLSFEDGQGSIGLTSNLTEALPHVARRSVTRRLWIDQICINQADFAERSVQVGLMSEIYKKAKYVMVWLGTEDESSRLCRQWLDSIDTLIPQSMALKVTRGSPEYMFSWRLLSLGNTFSKPDTDPAFATAIGKFLARPWFRRGWIVQEFLLANNLSFLTGELTFSLGDLEDFMAVPITDELSDAADGSMSYRILMAQKMYPNTDPQPLRFLRIMADAAGQFETKELVDRLYGFLGLIEGLKFTPSYTTPIRDNFTRFAATIASHYQSLDFLSLWSANIDAVTIGITPPELLGLPSWVPSFQPLPLISPYRLATGSARSTKGLMKWNAAAGRRHNHDQQFDAATTGCLQVRGQIIDHIDTISSCRINRISEIDMEYLTSLVSQIASDISGLDHWTSADLIHFLDTVSQNGHDTVRETAEQILGMTPGGFIDEYKHLHRHEDALAIALSMARGRRFARTEKGRLGLVPVIGSSGRKDAKRGSAIVVLHGCIVPIVLERVNSEADNDNDDEENAHWKVVGDCYIQDTMFGESVSWNVDQAKTFLLI